jgi:hypothetical protein
MKIKVIATLTFLALLSFGCEKEGLDGINGTDGTNGNNGVNGIEGKKSLVDLVTEPKGVNCSSGGLKITSGIDLNNNNILDATEIQNTKFVCNGVDGAYDKQLTFKLFDLISSPNGAALESINKYNSGYGGIVKFNIDNYINIDSAILVAYDLTARNSFNGVTVPETMKLELYDCKNSKVIIGSEIISGEIPQGNSVFSKNFAANLPHEDIELGIKLTKSADFYAETKDVVLILNRK